MRLVLATEYPLLNTKVRQRPCNVLGLGATLLHVTGSSTEPLKHPEKQLLEERIRLVLLLPPQLQDKTDTLTKLSLKKQNPPCGTGRQLKTLGDKLVILPSHPSVSVQTSSASDRELKVPAGHSVVCFVETPSSFAMGDAIQIVAPRDAKMTIIQTDFALLNIADRSKDVINRSNGMNTTSFWKEVGG